MERSDEHIQGRRATDEVHDEVAGLNVGGAGFVARAAEMAEAAAEAGADFKARALAIEAAGVHRRHEELLDIAVDEDGMSRELAEQAHELAHEEGLAPAYALALIASRVGVEELIHPVSGDDESIQQSPPDWVATGDVSREAITRERNLRSSFRRFRAHLDRSETVEQAVQSFLDEPDVGPITY